MIIDKTVNEREEYSCTQEFDENGIRIITTVRYIEAYPQWIQRTRITYNGYETLAQAWSFKDFVTSYALCNEAGLNPHFEAAACGNVAMLQWLDEKKLVSNPVEQDDNAWQKVSTFTLEETYNVSVGSYWGETDSDGRTIAHTAAENGRTRVLQWLLGRQENIELVHSFFSQLCSDREARIVRVCGNLDMLQFLLENNNSLGLTSTFWSKMSSVMGKLSLEAFSNNRVEIIQGLINYAGTIGLGGNFWGNFIHAISVHSGNTMNIVDVNGYVGMLRFLVRHEYKLLFGTDFWIRIAKIDPELMLDAIASTDSTICYPYLIESSLPNHSLLRMLVWILERAINSRELTAAYISLPNANIVMGFLYGSHIEGTLEKTMSTRITALDIVQKCMTNITHQQMEKFVKQVMDNNDALVKHVTNDIACIIQGYLYPVSNIKETLYYTEVSKDIDGWVATLTGMSRDLTNIVMSYSEPDISGLLEQELGVARAHSENMCEWYESSDSHSVDGGEITESAELASAALSGDSTGKQHSNDLSLEIETQDKPDQDKRGKSHNDNIAEPAYNSLTGFLIQKIMSDMLDNMPETEQAMEYISNYKKLITDVISSMEEKMRKTIEDLFSEERLESKSHAQKEYATINYENTTSLVDSYALHGVESNFGMTMFSGGINHAMHCGSIQDHSFNIAA